MLRGQTHPLIRGEFRGIDPATVRRSSRLPFALTIGGVTRPVTAHVHDWIDDPGGAAVSFDADVDVSLEAFDLEAPTALLVVRVADAVHVGVHVTVRRMGPTENHRP
jgi:polyisoprenoid-binding protein YceI